MKIIRFYVIDLQCQLCQREELPEDSLERRERSLYLQGALVEGQTAAIGYRDVRERDWVSIKYLG